MRLRPDLSGYSCGMHAVLGALNTAPCTIVSYCQMPRCHKVLSCLPQVLQRLWQTGLTTCLALTRATLTGSTSCAHLRFSNQTSVTSIHP